MSVATAEPGLIEEPVVRDEMPDGIAPRGVVLSVALHLVLGSLFIFGLPRLFAPPPPEDMPVAVELVTIAPETRATRPNPNPPRPNAKPEVPVADAPVAKPEPEPPVPTPVPPPSAEAPPAAPEPPKLPEPKPAPPPLLKNLATQPTAPSPDAPPQRPRVASARPSSQPRAPLGSQITASEVDLVRQQIARCWNVPAGARDAKDLVVEVRVAVDPDGTVRQATIVDQARLGSDPFFRAAAESARRAFFNPLCRPLHLPPDKYAIWKDLVVDFSPKDIL